MFAYTGCMLSILFSNHNLVTLVGVAQRLQLHGRFSVRVFQYPAIPAETAGNGKDNV